jgi:hypothetical protein
MVHVVPRAEKAVLLGIPQREDDRSCRGVFHEPAGHLQDQGGTGGVVGSAVADRVSVNRTAGPVVVVVRSDHHVLVRSDRAMDHAEHVHALVEWLLVGVDSYGARDRPHRHRPQLFDEPVAGSDPTRGVVVATSEVVRRQIADVGLQAAGEAHHNQSQRDEPSRSLGGHGSPPTFADLGGH